MPLALIVSLLSRITPPLTRLVSLLVISNFVLSALVVYALSPIVIVLPDTCAIAFTVPSFGISTFVPVEPEIVVPFTAIELPSGTETIALPLESILTLVSASFAPIISVAFSPSPIVIFPPIGILNVPLPSLSTDTEIFVPLPFVIVVAPVPTLIFPPLATSTEPPVKAPLPLLSMVNSAPLAPAL